MALFLVLLLAHAFSMQGSEAFSVKSTAVLGLSKFSTPRQCSQRFSLSCALKSGSHIESQRSTIILDRRHALGSLATAIALRLQPAGAVENSSASTTKTAPSEKQFRLSNDQLKSMIEADIRDRQFLVTGQLTR